MLSVMSRAPDDTMSGSSRIHWGQRRYFTRRCHQEQWANDLLNLIPRLEVVLWTSVSEDHLTQAIGSEPKTVNFLGEIGAFIDLDTYTH